MNYVPTGTMDTTVLNKKALAEGQLAMQLYTDYFGKVPFKEVTLTQQTACTMVRRGQDSCGSLSAITSTQPFAMNWAWIRRSRLLEKRHRARGGAPMVGPYGRL